MNEQRASVYRLLSALFSSEPDSGTLAALKAVRFPADGFPAEGQRFNEAVSALTEASPDALAADFARVFLGPGETASQYESVYTSPKGIIMQDAWAFMREALHSHGIGLAVNFPGLLEDHVSVELEYMAWLADCSDEAAQAAFLSQHLLGWLPRFCADVEKYAETEFYRAAAALLAAYLESDARFLAEKK